MARHHNINGNIVPFTAEEEAARDAEEAQAVIDAQPPKHCLLYTSPSPRDGLLSRMPSSA